MRVYLDACLPARSLDALRNVYPERHEFRDYQQEELSEMKDVPLFAEIRRRRFDLFITIDRSQLRKRDELDAIRKGGCSWLGFPQVSGRGVSQLARTASLLLESVTYIIDNPPTGPTAYRAKSRGSEHHQLFTNIIDLSGI